MLYRLTPSARDAYVRSNVRAGLWTSNMDNSLVPLDKVKELNEDTGRTMLLRDVQLLELGRSPVKFLGWMLERTLVRFRLMIDPQLIEDIVQGFGLQSTRRCATAGVKDRVVDETAPLVVSLGVLS